MTLRDRTTGRRSERSSGPVLAAIPKIIAHVADEEFIHGRVHGVDFLCSHVADFLVGEWAGLGEGPCRQACAVEASTDRSSKVINSLSVVHMHFLHQDGTVIRILRAVREPTHRHMLAMDGKEHTT